MATKRLKALSTLAAAKPPIVSAATAPLPSSAGLPLTYEQRVWASSPSALLCGVDEAGRGPLAGPVVAAACVALPPGSWSGGAPLPLAGVNDSKQVDEAAREALFPTLLGHPALCFGVSVVDHAAIDRVNILAAAMLAMERAVAAARAAAAARLALPPPPTAAALPAADAVDWAAAGAARPAPLKAPPPGVRRDTALHTVFIDGPRCPARIAEAAAGGYEGGGATGGGGSRKRGRGQGAAEPPPLAPSAGTVVDAAVDGTLVKRLGPIFTAQPVIGGDGKVFLIAAGACVCHLLVTIFPVLPFPPPLQPPPPPLSS
jgi:hypothetical protein